MVATVLRSRCALGAAVVEFAGDVAAEGKARAQPRPSRQPKWVPPLLVVVSRAYRHDAWSRSRRLGTTRSGGTRERLSTSRWFSARAARSARSVVEVAGDVVAEGKARAPNRPSRQPKRVPPLLVVVPRTHRHDACSRAPRLRTAGSGGTRERLSQSGGSALALRARRVRCRGQRPRARASDAQL
jgi:hypothetical protein